MSKEIKSKKFDQNAMTTADTITIINDTDQPVEATLSNGFLGPASSGYIAPGEKLALPCAPALWDALVLFLDRTEITHRWYGIGVPEIDYNKSQGNVGVGNTIHVSDMD